jgi:hypothetical protein
MRIVIEPLLCDAVELAEVLLLHESFAIGG